MKGRLLIVEEFPGGKCEAICDCGAIKRYDTWKAKTGHTRSCGCLKKRLISERAYKHGGVGKAAYLSWREMKSRCLNPRHHAYAYYGGRGIKISERWMHFGNFFADMGERPMGTSLDRIDPEGNYEPGNCRWATKLEQARNKRAIRKYQYKGAERCMAEIAELAGVDYQKLRARLVVYGWTVDRATARD